MHLTRLVYVSERTTSSPVDLDDIRRVSVVRNSADGITGALVNTPDTYIQLIEGPRRSINACFGRIFCDLRHTRIELILVDDALDRLFPTWHLCTFSAPGFGSGFLEPYARDHRLRPDELPIPVVEQLFQDLAAGLTSHAI